jgi:hypothetical protein
MYLGRFAVAFLLLLAVVSIALLIRSLNDGPERLAPAIGEASIQRVDESTTGSLPSDPVSEMTPATPDAQNNRLTTKPERSPSSTKSED